MSDKTVRPVLGNDEATARAGLGHMFFLRTTTTAREATAERAAAAKSSTWIGCSR